VVDTVLSAERGKNWAVGGAVFCVEIDEEQSGGR